MIKQLNTLKGWYRDSRNTPNPWKPINGEFHHLYRLLIYLEDYRNKSGAIFVIPRSHLTNNYKIPPLITKNPSRDITGRFINNIQDDLKLNINIKGIRLKIGDAVIIDHHILHRGCEQKHRAIFQYSFSIGKKSLWNNLFCEQNRAAIIQERSHRPKYYNKCICFDNNLLSCCGLSCGKCQKKYFLRE